MISPDTDTHTGSTQNLLKQAEMQIIKMLGLQTEKARSHDMFSWQLLLWLWRNGAGVNQMLQSWILWRHRDMAELLQIVGRTRRRMRNSEGNFVMVKSFYISNYSVILTECFYKLKSFCCFISTWKHLVLYFPHICKVIILLELEWLSFAMGNTCSCRPAYLPILKVYHVWYALLNNWMFLSFKKNKGTK